MVLNEPQILTSASGRERKPKLFVGLSIGPDTRERISEIAHRLEEQGLDARFEDPRKYHLTLAFLGWVDSSQVEPIRAAMQGAAVRTRPFNISLDTVAAFPDNRRARVVFLGARTAPEEFLTLCGLLRKTYSAMGFPFKDPAVTHVTLARINTRKSPVPQIVDFPPIVVPVGALTLFDSMPDKHTTRYEKVFSSPLGM